MQLPNIDFVGAALGVGLVAVLGAYLRNVPLLVGRYLMRFCVTTVVIDNRSNLFDVVIRWFNDLPYSRSCRLISAKFSPGTGQQPPGTTASPREELLCSPAPGIHLILHRRRLMLVYRELSVSQQVVESISISCIFGGRSFASALLDDVIASEDARSNSITRVYGLDRWGDGWKHTVSQGSRALTSVFLPKDMKESIRADIERFYQSKDRYVANGIAWTRGYLFAGPPGTGKTSLIKSLAHEFRLNLCLLSLVDHRVTDASLGELLMKLPPRAALVIEDIDSFFLQRKKEDASVRVSFSGLLNALDGAAVAEGRLLFVTTNTYSAVDSALIRPGRIDRVVEFGLMKHREIATMVEAFYGRPVQWPSGHLPEGRLSPATLQESMLRFPDDPQAALEALLERV